MGYINGTIPLERRRYYRDTRNLSALQSRWGRVLRERHGYVRGLRGWDWFGDPDKAPPGKPPIYHPHLGVLVDGGRISADKLEALKVSWAEVLGVPLHRSNLHYQYSDDPNKMMHWVNYITRPTFLDAEWDPEMAVRLIGFRTYQIWGRGKWDGEIKWDVPEGEAPPEAVQALVQGFCPLPDCGEKIEWAQGVFPGVLFAMLATEDLGAGFSRINLPP